MRKRGKRKFHFGPARFVQMKGLQYRGGLGERLELQREVCKSST